MTAWKNAKAEKTCSIFPHVWAALVGCTGKGRAWRYGVGHFGRQVAEFACPSCKAAADKLDAMTAVERSAELERLQAAAGVSDYRLAETRVVAGRPVLTGKLDRNRVAEALDSALYDYGCGSGDAARVVRLIVALGADCKALVARHCSKAQRAELVAAYRAARL
jgi:hypothetical protein